MIRTLGAGRAARAQLVEAQMPDGQIVRCVEKVFAPGRLTRWLYRIGFAAPFAYQTNRHAILACYYRRRVASAILQASDIDVEVAAPLYVRFCEQSKSWVLAAEWIDGRGIRPASADRWRFRRWIRRRQTERPPSEIDQLVRLMSAAEKELTEGGLTGSGWQVAPRALVSTANLLRQGERYTIIDLESGIPAVLVPKYIAASLRQATAPPFDDLDPARLQDWLSRNEKLLPFRMGIQAASRVPSDLQKLVRHTESWKASEIAPLRRPWRLLTRNGWKSYQHMTVERWHQDQLVDRDFVNNFASAWLLPRMVWWATWLPSVLGILVARLIGHRQARANFGRWITNASYRRTRWQRYVAGCQQQWVQQARMFTPQPLQPRQFMLHWTLSALPPAIHRTLTRPHRWRDHATTFALFLCSPEYQSWLGQRQINRSLERWVQAQRIDQPTARRLRGDSCGNEVRVYTRGFGIHLALKILAPIVIPAKIGSLMAFLVQGNPIFLIPLAATPLLRLGATTANWYQSRADGVRHREALAVCWLPVVGSIAYPLQMFATRPNLSTFLIRDAASTLGRKIPIYGGADSRTEIACIRAADFVIELLDVASGLTGRSRAPASHAAGTVRPWRRRGRFGRWLLVQAQHRMDAAQAAEAAALEPSSSGKQAA